MSLGLLSAVMLGWVASLLIPWLIDRWWPLPTRQLNWPSLRLVERALKDQARPPLRTPRNWLRTLRMLLLGLIAVAASEPVLRWPASGSVPVADSPQLVILALDAGYPMQAAAAGSPSHWEQLLSVADRQLSSLPPGTAAAVVRLGAQAEAVIPAATWDLTDLKRKVAGLDCSHALADLSGGLRLIEGIVQRWQQTQPAEQVQGVEVRWLSDFRRGSWAVAESADTLRVAQRLSERCRFVPIPVGSAVAAEPIASRNASLESVRLLEPLARPSFPATVETVIFNGGEQPLANGLLQLWSDAQLLATRPVSLEVGQRRRITMPWTPARSGPQALQVRLVLEDDLPIDNQRWLPIDVRQRCSVMIVEGEPGAGRYLELALRPDPAQPSPWELRRQVHTELDLRLLDPTGPLDALVLVDPGPELLWYGERLRRWCDHGGRLMVWLGPRAHSRALARCETLPFDLIEPAAVGSQSIDPLNYRAAWLAPFAAWPESGLIDTPLFRYWRIQLRPQTPLEVGLALSGGDPLVLEQRLGLGQGMWIVTPPTLGNAIGQTEDWNALPAWPTFLPLVQQLMQHLLADSERSSTLLVGEPLPNGWQLAPPHAGSEPKLAQPPTLETPGLLRLRPLDPQEAGDARPSRWLAVQLDPQGGWLTPLPLPQWLRESAPPPAPRDASVPSSRLPMSDLPLARWVIGLCLAMLLLESGLATNLVATVARRWRCTA